MTRSSAASIKNATEVIVQPVKPFDICPPYDVELTCSQRPALRVPNGPVRHAIPRAAYPNPIGQGIPSRGPADGHF
jgi:hypothetical protein